MLNIVTGKINSGKTTKIFNIYNENKIGDGFISVKNMDGSNVHSYDILRLSSNIKKVFVLHEKYISDNQKIACKIGPYSFLDDTLKYIESELAKLITARIAPIYLDEIGLLELDNQCFYQIFKELLQSGLDVYVVIREDLIQQIIEKYEIKQYKIIT